MHSLAKFLPILCWARLPISNLILRCMIRSPNPLSLSIEMWRGDTCCTEELENSCDKASLHNTMGNPPIFVGQREKAVALTCTAVHDLPCAVQVPCTDVHTLPCAVQVPCMAYRVAGVGSIFGKYCIMGFGDCKKGGEE